MKNSLIKTNAVTRVIVLSLLWSFITPYQLHAITAKDIEKAEKKVVYKEKKARKNNARAVELEEKLKKATEIVEAKKQELNIATLPLSRV